MNPGWAWQGRTGANCSAIHDIKLVLVRRGIYMEGLLSLLSFTIFSVCEVRGGWYDDDNDSHYLQCVAVSASLAQCGGVIKYNLSRLLLSLVTITQYYSTINRTSQIIYHYGTQHQPIPILM